MPLPRVRFTVRRMMVAVAVVAVLAPGLFALPYWREARIRRLMRELPRSAIGQQRCKNLGNEPFAYLRDVLDRVSTHPASRVDDLLPDRRVLPGPAGGRKG